MPSPLPAYFEADLKRITDSIGISLAETSKLQKGERREVSVLFLDMKGFTSMAERIDHEVVHHLIYRIMHTLSDIVEMSGGYVDKLEGDKIMALFGAKVASESDAVRAVDCALRMLDAIDEVNSILSSMELETGARAGISFGQVIVAPDAAGHLTATGDVVNVASRLESEAETGTVMVSDRVRQECGELFKWLDLGEIAVKGRTSRIHAWRPQGAGAERIERWERASRISGTPFLGRKQELKMLQNTWNSFIREKNSSGKHTLIEIRGEAGIGKSRLAHEFLSELRESAVPPWIITGRTVSRSQPPLRLWSTMMKDSITAIRINGSDCSSPDSLVQDMADNLEDEEKNKLLESKPFLQKLLSIDPEDSTLDRMNNESRQRETMIAMRRFLRASATIHRTVVVLEDIHWMDSASMELLEFILSDSSEGHPVLFLLIRRPGTDETPGWRVPGDTLNYREIGLQPLDDSDCRLIIRNMLDIPEFCELENLVLELTKGNPFFIEELVLEMIESGSLIETGEGWRLSGNVNETPVPSSVTGILISRIDRLPKSLKEALLRSSVLGCSFRGSLFESFSGMLDDGYAIATPDLKELCRRGFLVSFTEGNVQKYNFQHALMRDAAYGILLYHNRIILHRFAAEALEADFTRSETEEMAVVIADHWSSAGNMEKAIEWGRIALEQCKLNYYIKEGLAVTEKLTDWIGSQPGSSFRDSALFEVMMNQEMLLFLLARREEEIRIQKDLLYLTDSLGADKKVYVNERIGRMEIFRGKLEAARVILETTLEESERVDDLELRARILFDMAILSTKQWKSEEARVHAEKALEIYERINDLDSQCMVLNALGTSYWRLGTPEDGLVYFQKAYELSVETRNRWYQGNTIGNIGIIYNNMGDKKSAREYYGKALAIHRELGNLLSEAHVLANLGVLTFEQNRYEESRKYYERALDLYRQTDNTLLELRTMGKLGRLCLRTDNLAEAEEYLRASLQLQEQTGLTRDESETRISMGEFLIRTGRYDEAEEQLLKAAESGRELGDIEDEIMSNCLMTQIAIARGDMERACTLFRKMEKVNKKEDSPEIRAKLNELRRILNL